MQIKRFQAATMAEALGLVKKELGPEAVILSACSRKKVKGLFGSFKKAGVEVTAAGNGPFPPTEPNQARTNSEEIHMNRRPYPVGSHRIARPKMTEKISYSPPRPSVRKRRNFRSRNRIDGQHMMDRTESDSEHWLQKRIINQGVDDTYVQEIIAEAGLAEQKLVPETEDTNNRVAEILQKIGAAHQSEVIKSDQQRCMAVIGATGAGKTTAISKLAAAYTLDAKQRVALISLDNIRVAASDQLQVFAEIIDIPLEVVSERAGLETALENFRMYDLILIDTPGLSFRDTQEMAVLSEWLGVIESLEIHLLFSATGRLCDHINFFRNLKDFNISQLMFSKIDETVYHGDILNTILRLQQPVSFFFNQAAGPEGVIHADLNLLADLITRDVESKHNLMTPGGGEENRECTRPVPMRWMPLADENNFSSEHEDTDRGDALETGQGRSRSGFFRFHGKRKRCTTA
jgi:flagellar biosynthesis protein FlhF